MRQPFQTAWTEGTKPIKKLAGIRNQEKVNGVQGNAINKNIYTDLTYGVIKSME